MECRFVCTPTSLLRTVFFARTHAHTVTQTYSPSTISSVLPLFHLVPSRLGWQMVKRCLLFAWMKINFIIIIVVFFFSCARAIESRCDVPSQPNGKTRSHTRTTWKREKPRKKINVILLGGFQLIYLFTLFVISGGICSGPRRVSCKLVNDQKLPPLTVTPLCAFIPLLFYIAAVVDVC